MTEQLERRFVILDGQGLHARAATRFARIATGFDARIEVARDGATGDGKRVMDVLMLVATPGDEVTVRAQGPDASAALTALTELVTNELGAVEPRAPARGGAGSRQEGHPPPASRHVENADTHGPSR